MNEIKKIEGFLDTYESAAMFLKDELQELFDNASDEQINYLFSEKHILNK